MEYIVYQTTNLENKKIYIGVHQTLNSNVFDGYIGCGVNINRPSTYSHPKTPFQYAVKKYGTDKFIRTTLFVFETSEAAYAKEAELVNSDFVKLEQNYNVALGGSGGSTIKEYPIYQFDELGNLINSWKSIYEASEYYGISKHSIDTSLQFNERCRGYYWSKDSSIDVSKYSKGDNKIPVYKYTKYGKCVAIYESIILASEIESISRPTLSTDIKLLSLVADEFYFSDKLYDVFIPSPKKSLKNIKFYIYTLDGDFVKEFSTGKELLNFLGKKSWNTIYRAIHALDGIYKEWQIKTEYLGEHIEAKQNKSKAKKVLVYSKEGLFIKECDSVLKAIHEFNVTSSGINRVLRGLQNTTGGYVFKWKLNDIV